MADHRKHWIEKIKADPCLCYSSLIFILAVDILSITALSIGFTFRGQCSIEKYIPIYLIVGGFIYTLYYTFLLIIMFIIIRSHSIDVAQISKRKVAALSISISMMCLFMTIWLIVGSIWVFGAKSTVQYYDSTQSTYCPSTLYGYSFFYCIFLLIICFTHYISCCCVARN